jgi:hypothetical protein
VHAAAKVTTALERIADGNLSTVKPWVAAFWNTRSISAQATASILGVTAKARWADYKRRRQ